MSNTILVIENDQAAIDQINQVLGDRGYAVSSATSADTGLSMAGTIVPSMIFINLATPGTNGLEICKTIHNTDGLTDVPIVLLTLREGKFEPVYTKLYGIVAFLKKPFEDDALTTLAQEHSPMAEAEAEAEPEEEAEAGGWGATEDESGEFDVEGGDESLSDLQASFQQPLEYPEGGGEDEGESLLVEDEPGLMGSPLGGGYDAEADDEGSADEWSAGGDDAEAGAGADEWSAGGDDAEAGAGADEWSAGGDDAEAGADEWSAGGDEAETGADEWSAGGDEAEAGGEGDFTMGAGDEMEDAGGEGDFSMGAGDEMEDAGGEGDFSMGAGDEMEDAGGEGDFSAGFDVDDAGAQSETSAFDVEGFGDGMGDEADASGAGDIMDSEPEAPVGGEGKKMQDNDYGELFEDQDAAPAAAGKSGAAGGKGGKKKGFKKPGASPKKLLIIIGVVVLLAGLGAAAYFMFLAEPAPKKRATPPPRPKPAVEAPAPAPVEPAAPAMPTGPMDLPPLPDVTGQAPAPAAPAAPTAPAAPAVAPKAPAAPAASAPTPGVQQGMYYVQFGLFGSAKNAERMAKNMRAEGLRVTIIKVTVKGKVMNYVLLDETFPTRDAATKRAMQIKKQIKQDTAVYHAK